MARNAQFNKTIQTVLGFMLDKKKMTMENDLRKDVIDRQMSGYEGLEDLRSRNDMAQLAQANADKQDLEAKSQTNALDRLKAQWVYALSQKPEIEQIMGSIFKSKEMGEDPSPYEEQLRTVIAKTSLPIYKAIKGDLKPEDIGPIVELGDQMARELFTQAASGSRQTQEINEVDKPKIANEAFSNVTARMNAETSAGKGSGNTRKELLSLVDKTVTRLQASIRSNPVFGGTIDPLSGDNRGQALTYLQQMSVDLSRGIDLKPEQDAFLTQVLDLEKLEKKGTKNVMFPKPPIEDIGGKPGQVIGKPTPAGPPTSQGTGSEVLKRTWRHPPSRTSTATR
jgi:hypothetical protein